VRLVRVAEWAGIAWVTRWAVIECEGVATWNRMAGGDRIVQKMTGDEGGGKKNKREGRKGGAVEERSNILVNCGADL
jgi:hypothetical protein